MILLLHPPIAKPSEPPAGIAQLAGTLRSNNISCQAIDLNIEALYSLFARAHPGSDRWSKRSYHNLNRNLARIRQSELYNNFSHYQKCVLELNRVLEIQGGAGITASLANYADASCSPVRSDDLLRIAGDFENNIFFPFLQERLAALLEEYQPHYVGLSMSYLSQAITSFAILGYLRTTWPKIKTIVGGGLMTSWMRKPDWSNPFHEYIDHCIDGCGEKPLLELFDKKQYHPAPPDYEPFDVEKYFAPGFILPYNSSTGCYWNRCDFCPERAEGNSFSGKPVERVIADIETLRQQHQPVLLHLLDNAVPQAVLKRFSRDVPGLPWYGFVRLTHHFLDLDFCKNLRESGCVMLKIGIESGSQRVLDLMIKGVRLEDISLALRNLEEAGISTYVYLLFGTPHENYAEARSTLDFTVAHHRFITFLNLAIFNMPISSGKGSALTHTSFYDGDLSLYTNFDHPTGWHRKKVRLFLEREFKKHPDIRPITQRDPAIFTSNHAPFFCRPSLPMPSYQAGLKD